MAAKKKAAVKAKAPEKPKITEVFNEIEKPYTLRDFKDGDLIPLLRILRKLGLKSFKKAFLQITDGKSIKEVGIDVVIDMADIMIEALDSEKAADDIYNLYSSLSGIAVKDIKEMEFGTLPMMILDSFQAARNTTFFMVLAKLL